MTDKLANAATKKHYRQEIQFSEFEPLLNQLRSSADITQTEAAKLIGYEGSAISGWKSSNSVPVVAFNSLKWVLHEQKNQHQNSRPAHPTFNGRIRSTSRNTNWTSNRSRNQASLD